MVSDMSGIIGMGEASAASATIRFTILSFTPTGRP
jgi:hypothetical protein